MKNFNDKKKVAVIDYGMGNLFSVEKACEYVGLMPVITSDKKVISDASAAILPGVGAFGDAMDTLKRLDLVSVIKDFIQSGKPFMGICLGMQLLMSESEEFGLHRGIDIFKGRVIKFKNDLKTIKVPQVGWNQILMPERKKENYWSGTPLENIKNGEYMYFVHSYHAVCEDENSILTMTDYEGVKYSSGLLKNNVLACQFHPEKSASEGIKIYKNWANLIK